VEGLAPFTYTVKLSRVGCKAVQGKRDNTYF